MILTVLSRLNWLKNCTRLFLFFNLVVLKMKWDCTSSVWNRYFCLYWKTKATFIAGVDVGLMQEQAITALRFLRKFPMPQDLCLKNRDTSREKICTFHRKRKFQSCILHANRIINGTHHSKWYLCAGCFPV